MPVGLHPLRGGDALGVIDLARSPETWCRWRGPSFGVQHVATAASGEPASDTFGEPCGGSLGCGFVGVPVEPVHLDGSHLHFLTGLARTERAVPARRATEGPTVASVKALHFTPVVARIALSAMALILTACGSTTTTATKTVTTASTTPIAQPPHSQLIDVVLPLGSTCDCSSGIEVWKMPSRSGSYSDILENLRAQLPLNKPFDGLPWRGEQVNPTTDSTTWKWDDGHKRIVVMVQTDGFISIQRMPDDPVSQHPPDG